MIRLVTTCVMLTVGGAVASDTVTLAPSDPGEPPLVRSGTIVDFNGQYLRMRTESPLIQQYPTPRVLRISTTWNDKHRAALDAADRGAYREAINRYHEALGAESRIWARRKILAELISCYVVKQQYRDAVRLFRLLLESDPETSEFHIIPLAWIPTDSIPHDEAQQWLDDSDAANRLLGASHLMASNLRSAAQDVLKGLVRHADPRIAALAEAQLWRAEIVHAAADTADRWYERVVQMPASLRAGPMLLVGQVELQAGRYERAAQTLLKIPVLYPEHRLLACQALSWSADALERLERTAQADRILQELAYGHGDTRWGAEARRRLDTASPTGRVLDNN